MYNQSEAILQQYDLEIKQISRGRGAYICRNRECLRLARKNKGLERSFKMSIPNEVYDTLEKEFDNLETE